MSWTPDKEARHQGIRADVAEEAARDLWAALDGITDHDPTEANGKPWIDAHAALSKWREFRVEEKGDEAK